MKQMTLTLAVTAFLAAAGSAHAADAIRIGHLSASGGPFATAAAGNGIAIEIAVEEINARGGINGTSLEVTDFDTAGDPAQAVVGFRRFARDEGVLAVVGPFSSGEARVVFPQADRLGVVSMSMGSSAPKLAEPFAYGFRNTTNEALMFNAVVATLQKNADLAFGSVGIAYASDDAISVALGEKVFPAILNRAGVEILETVSFKYAAFDMSVQAAELTAAAPDVVAVGAPSEAAIKLAKALKRQGYGGRLIASSTIFDVNLPERMGSDGIGAVMPTSFYWGRDSRTEAFSEEFRERAKAEGLPNTAPSQFDAASYTIVHLYAEAMARAGLTGDPSKLKEERTALRDALADIQNFDAIEGTLSVGTDGDVVKPVYVMEITQDGWALSDVR